MSLANWQKFNYALVQALGLQNQRVEKVVIEAEVGHPVRIYVRGQLKQDQIDPIIQAVKDVTVSDRAEVTMLLPDEPTVLPLEDAIFPPQTGKLWRPQ